MYQIVEYFKYNPRATAMDAVSYYENELAIPKQVNAILNETERVPAIRRELRPLYGKRTEIKEKMQYELSAIEGEVYMTYPPRKGSDAEREVKRNELKQANNDYLNFAQQLKDINMAIDEKEDELKDLEQASKNARRLQELFVAYTTFIQEYRGGRLQ